MYERVSDRQFLCDFITILLFPAEWQGFHSCDSQASSREYPQEASVKNASVPQGNATAAEGAWPPTDTVPGICPTALPAAPVSAAVLMGH